MTDDAFSVLLDLFMVNDPWPLGYGHDTIEQYLDDEARARGFSSWVVAYHEFNLPEIVRRLP